MSLSTVGFQEPFSQIRVDNQSDADHSYPPKWCGLKDKESQQSKWIAEIMEKQIEDGKGREGSTFETMQKHQDGSRLWQVIHKL